MGIGRDRSGIESKAPPVMEIKVNGTLVIVDTATLSLHERQQMKKVLATVTDADEIDTLAATIWVVMRRDDAALTFDEVCSALTIESLTLAEEVKDNVSPEA